MNEQEAIKILKRDLSIQIENKSLPDGIMAIETAIKALEKVQEYEKLGTVEEFKEAKHIESVYEQIKWERDVAITQLNEIGVELGRKMDDIKTLIKNNKSERIVHQDKEKERLIKSDEDCADCLCRVCAKNSCNDSYNSELKRGYAYCSCNCNIGDKLIETEDDCPDFLPDEDLL